MGETAAAVTAFCPQKALRIKIAERKTLYFDHMAEIGPLHIEEARSSLLNENRWKFERPPGRAAFPVFSGAGQIEQSEKSHQRPRRNLDRGGR